MSQSRLERVGSIYSRMHELLKSGARKADFRPLWFDLYAAFPPKYEPRWDRKIPGWDKPLNKILYREDAARAQFFKQYGDRTEVS